MEEVCRASFPIVIACILHCNYRLRKDLDMKKIMLDWTLFSQFCSAEEICFCNSAAELLFSILSKI